MNTFIYEFESSLYFNLTNKCSCACTFCLRLSGDGIGGNSLWLSKEPTVEEVIAVLKQKDLNKYKEAVFCGFGEPTYRLDAIIEIAQFLRTRGVPTRLDTNGHGNYINDRDITPELKRVINKVSISLNSATAEGYNLNTRPAVPDGYNEMLNFAAACVKQGIILPVV